MSNPFVIPSSSDILQQAINDQTAIMSSQGYNVVIDPNGETYARLATDAQMVAVLYYLANQANEQKMIDTATGSDLDRLANNRNIYRKGATSSQGQVQFQTATSQTIVAGSLLTGPNSLQYKVSTTGVYSDNQAIPVQSLNQGSTTNLEVGETLTWVNQPFNSQSSAPVFTVITGGSDAETDDDLRSRVLAIIQYPPQAGNASQLQNLAGTVDPIVQTSFIYGNYNGAGTLLIVLMGNQTTSYIGRDIPHLPLDNYLPGTTLVSGIPTPSSNIEFGLVNDPTTTTPYNEFAYTDLTFSTLKNTGSTLSNATSALYGQLPINVGNPYATAITTVNNYPVSLSLSLSLPGPAGSNVNGAGSGWLNFNTWPNPDGYWVNDFCSVVSISPSAPSVLTFIVQAASLSNAGAVGPTAGVTQISWVNRSDAQNTGWLVQTSVITIAVDNGNNTWTITINSPFTFPAGQSDFYGNTGLAIGDFIFPASANAQTYLTTLMQEFAALGPGEMTTSQGLQSIGAVRFPSSAAQFPSIIDERFLKNLIVNNAEIANAEFVNNNGVYAIDDTSIFATPPPASAPPNVFVPLNIAMYDANWVNYLQ